MHGCRETGRSMHYFQGAREHRPPGGLIGGLLRPQFRRCLKDATDGACFVSMSYCTRYPREILYILHTKSK